MAPPRPRNPGGRGGDSDGPDPPRPRGGAGGTGGHSVAAAQDAVAQVAAKGRPGAGGEGTPESGTGGDETTQPRDIHGSDRVAAREVDVDYVWEHGEMYFQDDGQIVKVLDNGNGTFDIVVRDMSNPSGTPTTVISGASENYIRNKLDSERWWRE